MHRVSDDAVDEVVEVCFRALPAMDPNELGGLVNALLRIIGRERERVLAEYQAAVCHHLPRYRAELWAQWAEGLFRASN